MLPEWNIKGVVIQPGGFKTEWSGSSMQQLPLPAAYDTPHSPTALFRKNALNRDMAIGDPHKAARAVIEVAGLADPPLRVQLGTDSLTLVRNQAHRTLAECDRMEELAHTTNADGVDRALVVEKLSAANL